MTATLDPPAAATARATARPVSRLRRLAEGCYRHRRAVVAGWVGLLIGVTAIASAAGGELDDEFSTPGAESQEAFDLLTASGFADRAGRSVQLVIDAPDGAGTADIQTALDGVLVRIAAEVPDAEIVSPFGPGGERQIAPEASIAYAQLNLADRPSSDYADAGHAIRDVADGFDVPGARLLVGGDPNVVGEEEPGSEGLGMVAAAVILFLAFGSLLAMGLPLVTALVGVGCGVAIVGLLANVITMPTFTNSAVLMLGVGVGIDYALFIVTRFRAGLHDGLGPMEAVAQAMDTAGRAVLFAGGTVIISVLGLLVVGSDLTTALAVAAATGVLLTMLASVTLLPALLGFVGRNIDRLGLPHARRSPDARGLSHRWSRVVQRRPLPALVISLAMLLGLAAPVFGMRLGFTDNGNRFETGDSLRDAYDLLADGFGPGFNGPLLLAAELPNGAVDLDTLERLRTTLTATSGVASVTPPIPNAVGNAAIMQVYPTTGPQDEATTGLVRRLRDEVLPATEADGVSVHTGGVTAAAIDYSDFTASRMPLFIGAVLILSFLLLMATFRSVLVPLKAVLMNLLSIGAAYGVVVAVFQWGWGSDLLGTGDPGPVEAWAPMMLFAIVFGLSMDYEVFLLSRIKEEHDRTGDNAEAVANGLASTARVITAAAGIMFFVFGGFVLSPDRALQIFGLGLAVAVLVDATIVRLVLVPATMELLGERNWWLPSWLDRILPRIHVEGPQTPAPSTASSA